MSLVLPSVQAERGIESRDRHSDEARMCLHKPWLCDLVYLSHTHARIHNAAAVTLSHTCTHTQIVIAKSELPSVLGSRNGRP